MKKRNRSGWVGRTMFAGTLGLLLSGCEGALVEPGPDPGVIALALAPTEPSLQVAPAGANRVRVQIRADGGVVLDTLSSFEPGQAELYLPLRSGGARGGLVEILVEIGRDGRPLLRGRTDVVVEPRGVTDAQIRLAGAPVAPVTGATDLAAGVYHSCATVADDGLYCWGNNQAGQIGDGDFVPALTAVNVPVEGGLYQVSAGFLSTCGLDLEGVAYCWGDNQFGSLGTPTSPSGSEVPLSVDSEDRYSTISVGGLHACALRLDGTAYCWGFNGFGQLGDGTTTDRATPVQVAYEGRFRSISAGYIHTCGVTTLGEVLCWGLNEFGQLGDGTLQNRNVPGFVALDGRFSGVTAGGLHSCAWSAVGEAYCWGLDNMGQLGAGQGADRERPTPTPVSNLRFVELSAGGLHSCGVAVDGTGHCWGYNGSGALGDGSTADRAQPVQISGGQRFTALRTGLHHSCGTVESGTVRCWGYNRFGQLGDGSRDNRALPQEVIQGDPFFIEVPEGEYEVAAAVKALVGGSLVVPSR